MADFNLLSTVVQGTYSIFKEKTHELNYVYYVNDSEHIYDPEWWVYKIVGKDCTPVLIWPSVQ